MADLVQHHRRQVAHREAIGDDVDQAAAAIAHRHGERTAVARGGMTAVDLGDDPGALAAKLRHGAVGRIGRQQHRTQAHEAVQHVVPLPQCQPDAFALGGIEVAIDVDGERARSHRGGRGLVGVTVGGGVVARITGRRGGRHERKRDSEGQQRQAGSHQYCHKPRQTHREPRSYGGYTGCCLALSLIESGQLHGVQPHPPPPYDGRAIAYGDFRRLDRSAKRGAERPSVHDKWPIVDGRSLRSGRSLPRAKSRGPSVETTEVGICDRPAYDGGGREGESNRGGARRKKIRS